MCNLHIFATKAGTAKSRFLFTFANIDALDVFSIVDDNKRFQSKVLTTSTDNFGNFGLDYKNSFCCSFC